MSWAGEDPPDPPAGGAHPTITARRVLQQTATVNQRLQHGYNVSLYQQTAEMPSGVEIAQNGQQPYEPYLNAGGVVRQQYEAM